jgi:hypothetical protein
VSLLVPAPAAVAAEQPQTLPEKLSDERTLSRWAHTSYAAKVRAEPRAGSRSIARLRYLTEHKQPETYPALRSHVDEQAETWIEVRLPMRPNGRKGWVKRRALGPLRVVRTYLRVNRKTFRATLYRSGRNIFSARVGVGMPGYPTPAGRFWGREKVRLPRGHPLGPLNIGIGAYARRPWHGSRLVGLCGTNRPETVPGRVTPGSIRLRNGDLLRLSRLMPLGTPVRVL